MCVVSRKYSGKAERKSLSVSHLKENISFGVKLIYFSCTTPENKKHSASSQSGNSQNLLMYIVSHLFDFVLFLSRSFSFFFMKKRIPGDKDSMPHCAKWTTMALVKWGARYNHPHKHKRWQPMKPVFVKAVSNAATSGLLEYLQKRDKPKLFSKCILAEVKSEWETHASPVISAIMYATSLWKLRFLSSCFLIVLPQHWKDKEIEQRLSKISHLTCVKYRGGIMETTTGLFLEGILQSYMLVMCKADTPLCFTHLMRSNSTGLIKKTLYEASPVPHWESNIIILS